jgi:DNA repair protein RadC
MRIDTIIETMDAPGIAELRIILKRPPGDLAPASETEERVAILRQAFDDDTFDVQEQMILLLLDSRERLIATYPIASGTIDECRADFAKIIRAAAVVNAHTVVIGHNHPEGEALASINDVKFANSISHCLEFADFALSDMIILTRTGHFSFFDEGLLHE